MTAPLPRSSGLPYGAVMATGAAAHLAPAAGVPVLAEPLVWLTVAQALLLAACRLLRRVRSGDRGPQPPAARRFGLFTVPIGCTVIGTDLAAGAATRATLAGAAVAVALGWLATAWLLARVVTPLALRPPGTAAVEGTWFLAPAALLADAIGTVAVLPHLPAAHTALAWLALLTCAAGVLGYALLVPLATIRVRTHGLAGAAHAPWWISAGCAGLAAAAVGRVATTTPVTPTAAPGFAWAALALWAVGSVLLVPVLAAGLRHLWRLRRPWGAATWPPTFSTGVYALGAGQAAALNHLPAIQAVHRVAAAGTLALWAATAALALVHLGRDRRTGARLRKQN